MFDFGKVAITLKKIEEFLTEQKKIKKVETISLMAATIYAAGTDGNTTALAVSNAAELYTMVTHKFEGNV
jgi:hypothetical protein